MSLSSKFALVLSIISSLLYAGRERDEMFSVNHTLNTFQHGISPSLLKNCSFFICKST